MRTISASAFAFTTILVSASACGPSVMGGDDTGGDDGGDDGPSPDAGIASTQRCQKMDLLFVVDDSGSMAEEQTNLATNFPQFATVLDAYMVEAGLPLDYRVAVTTTGRDVDYTQTLPPPFSTSLPMSEQGDDGAMRQSCGMTRRWLERTDASVPSTFACAANVGTSGPSLEMPLYASELALGARISDGTNAGFVREDALLAIVYLTDENDCSRRDNNFTIPATGACTDVPTQSYVDFFDGVKGDRGRWATAVIAGPNDCSSAFGEAAAAPRLQQFVAEVGENAIFTSICEGNLAPALMQALDTFTAACESFPDVE